MKKIIILLIALLMSACSALKLAETLSSIREGVAVEYVSCEPTGGMRELFPEQYGEGDDSFEEEETEQA
jgi:hypothetical protein